MRDGWKEDKLLGKQTNLQLLDVVAIQAGGAKGPVAADVNVVKAASGRGGLRTGEVRYASQHQSRSSADESR